MAYLGGKGNCFRHIVNAMPGHEIYIETHLGGGAVLRAKRPASRQIGIDIDPGVIERWRAESPACELVCADALDFVGNFPFSGTELVYADPPYPEDVRSSPNRYRHEYTLDDHARLLDVLIELPCPVIVSGGPSSLYQQRLAKWRTKSFKAGARRGPRIETIWMNFPPPAQLHDTRYIGDDFREREKRKRRLSTLTRRIEKLHDLDQVALAQWFAERYPGEHSCAEASPL